MLSPLQSSTSDARMDTLAHVRSPCWLHALCPHEPAAADGRVRALAHVHSSSSTHHLHTCTPLHLRRSASTTEAQLSSGHVGALSSRCPSTFSFRRLWGFLFWCLRGFFFGSLWRLSFWCLWGFSFGCFWSFFPRYFFSLLLFFWFSSSLSGTFTASGENASRGSTLQPGGHFLEGEWLGILAWM